MGGPAVPVLGGGGVAPDRDRGRDRIGMETAMMEIVIVAVSSSTW